MARPKKSTDTPELREVQEKKKEWTARQADADAARAKFEQSVVKALDKSGFKTLSEISEMSIGAMRNITEKHAAKNPRARG